MFTCASRRPAKCSIIGEHGAPVCAARESGGTGLEPSLIRTLDGDLGKSGTQTAGREDFKTLVADVSMGKVGAVFALEASRLSRSYMDWHRLLEFCALTGTLVIDEDGCYDPADFNDGFARTEGNHGPGRAPFFSRAPPGR